LGPQHWAFGHLGNLALLRWSVWGGYTMASSDNASDYGEYSDAMSPGSSSDEDYGYNDDDSNWQESKAKDCKAAYKIIDNNQLESLQVVS
jgi:hypothetical protein